MASAHGGQKSWCSLRPEKISIAQKGDKIAAKSCSAKGQVTSVNYQGAVTRIAILAEGTRLVAAVAATDQHCREGDDVHLFWARESLVAMENS